MPMKFYSLTPEAGERPLTHFALKVELHKALGDQLHLRSDTWVVEAA